MWKKLIRRTKFRDQADELSAILVKAGVTDIPSLENSPRWLGIEVYGVNIYSLITAILEADEAEDKTPFLRELEIDKVTEKHLEALGAAGVYTVRDVMDLGVDGLAQIEGIGQVTAERVYKAAEGADTSG